MKKIIIGLFLLLLLNNNIGLSIDNNIVEIEKIQIQNKINFKSSSRITECFWCGGFS